LEAGSNKFGNYEFIRQLGAGGMGEIFLARQIGIPGIERLVVVKKVLPHLVREPGFVDRFLDEMRVASMLTHGNIVQVYEAGEVDGQYFMAMEYVDGMDLRRLFANLKDKGRLIPEDLALYILTEAAKGLSYAHERCDADGRSLNIVHRDVSPANLLISFDGQVKLTDFGVALATARLSLSIPGTLHGKVSYMSPEQVTGEKCDARSDLFGIGVIFYEALTGTRPFDADNDAAVIESVRKCDPVPIADAGPRISSALGAIVMRALAREPDERYRTMNEFVQVLTDYSVKNGMMVSSHAVSDFMEGIRPSAGTNNGVASSHGVARSLDEVAGELLEYKKADLYGTCQPGKAPDMVEPSGLHGRPRNEDEPGWSGMQAVVAVLIVAGLTGGLWIMGRLGSFVGNDSTFGRSVAIDASVVSKGPGQVSGSDAIGPLDVGVDTTNPVSRDAMTGPDEDRGGTSSVDTGQRHVVRLNSVPVGASIFRGKRLVGHTPLGLVTPGTGRMRLEVKLEGYETRVVPIGRDSPSLVTVTLTEEATGRLKFRFFPASSRVLLDGRPMKARGNVVDSEVPVGTYILEVRSADGTGRRSVQVTVESGKTVELGTIELGDGREDAP